MRYKAKVTLNTKRGLVHPGEIVPNSYVRIQEALRRGWIEEAGDEPDAELTAPPAPAPPVKPVPVSPGGVVDAAPPADPIELPDGDATDEVPVATDANSASVEDAGTEEVSPEEDPLALPVTGDTCVIDLAFIGVGQAEALDENLGIKHVKDLTLYAANDLIEVKGIGESTAAKLLEALESTKV